VELEDAIYLHMSTHAGLTALVSDRIYPNDIPKTRTYPLLVYELADGQSYEAMGKRPGIGFSTYRFTCYGTVKSDAVAVAKQVKAAWDYFSGTIGTVEIEWAKVERELDEDPESMLTRIGEAARNQYGRVVDILINHRE
jgi:hypothetical protein